MTNQTTFDPFTIWKDLYDQTESAFRESIQSTLEQPAFAESLGQVQKQYLQYQGVVNGMTEAYLKQLNVPTRDEIASIASLVINVESKVIDLEDQLDDVETAGTIHAREIKALKTSVIKLDKKLDTIIDLLSKQQATIKPTTTTPQKSTATSMNPTAQNKK